MPEINSHIEWTGVEVDPQTEALVEDIKIFLGGNKNSDNTRTEYSARSKIALAFLGGAATVGVMYGTIYGAKYLADVLWNSVRPGF